MRYPRIGVDVDAIELNRAGRRSFELLKLMCCDCGLVHLMSFAIEANNRLGIAMRRDNRATSAARRYAAMPLPKARKGSKKKARQKVVSKVIRKLNQENASMPKKQKVAIALKRAGLARKRKK
jgi:hypothetical protein